MSRAGSIRRRRARAVRCALGILAIAILGGLIHLSTIGFPPRLAEWVLGQINARSVFVLSAESLRLLPNGSVLARNARVFREGVVGPPAAEAAEVVVALDPRGPFERRLFIRRIAVKHGTVRPRFAFPTNVSGRVGLNFRVKTWLDVTDCHVDGIRIERLTCEMSGFGPLLHFGKARGALQSGGLKGDVAGDVTYDSTVSVLSGRLDGRVDPHLFLPILREWEQNVAIETIRRFEWPASAPRFVVTFRKTTRREGPLIGDAQFWMERGFYRNIPVLRADGKITYRLTPGNADVEVRPLFVARDEGTLRGGFRILSGEGLVTFDGESTMDPRDLARMVGIFKEPFLKAVRFDGQVRMAGSGTADYREIVRTDFRGRVSGRGMGFFRFVTDDGEFDVAMKGRTVELTEGRARIYGGDLTARATFLYPPPGETNVSFDIEATLRDAEFARLAQALMEEGHEKYRGQLRGSVRVRGAFDAQPERTLVGEGKVRITDGRVFMMPLFGGFSDYMTRIIPGLDLVLRQTEANADFTLRDGLAHSDRVAIEGGVLSLSGRGDYRFDGQLDFHAQVKLLRDNLVGKLVRLPTWIFSKLFEFRLRGTPSDPSWYLLNFSPELLQRVGLVREKPEASGTLLPTPSTVEADDTRRSDTEPETP
jgi:hypothetical protein